jgi:hypothetical protein
MPELFTYSLKGISLTNNQDSHQGEANIILSLEGKIPVLHSAEVAHLYPQVMLPICQEMANPIHLYRGGEAG